MQTQSEATATAPLLAHAMAAEAVIAELETSRRGLELKEVHRRFVRYGPNAIPRGRIPTLGAMFLGQFKSPLIYVLLLAAVVSLFLQAWSDAGFIFAVLLINAAIGTFQEYRAERSAQALQGLISPMARVVREDETLEINADQLVLGDIVLLESGAKVPADLRLIETHNLSVDESLLTGESLAAAKDASVTLASGVALAERANMAFAGTLVNTGRARGVVMATGAQTELGQIAVEVLGRTATKAPLILRMERFTHRIALAVGAATLVVAAISLARGAPLSEIFLLAVALAVSAIPEGLPVALTVALAVGMERMARRGVVVRRLVAVEALGSCTYIASDKTGTLTANQLTVRKIQFPGLPAWDVTGEGLAPKGTFLPPQSVSIEEHVHQLNRLARIVALANEATLAQREEEWVGLGDSMDLALLALAHKAGFTQAECLAEAPQLAIIPYESERRFAASLNRFENGDWAFVKGAVETLLPMCGKMTTAVGDVPLAAEEILAEARRLASDGYRVLAAACGPLRLAKDEIFSAEHLHDLSFTGLLALSDPPRAEAILAVDACRRAGITVGMVTGDHPLTALSVANDLGLAQSADEVVSGADLAGALGRTQEAFDAVVARSRVFARVEPEQKLQIVESLQRAGHFVAVTGDGVNDAPALRAAHVGVAMGQRGTDVARETAEIVITDDNFVSIVAGIEEGRIAYNNVRKVIFLLISTGAAEIVLFMLTLLAGWPLPLLAVQLLWLNLVTNGIQDVALAFEPAEGRELARPPRPPSEGVFNRLMIERVLIFAVLIGSVAFVAYGWMLDRGYSLDEARNGTLLLMVLFENVQAFNSRSETLSVFAHSPLRNKVFLFGTLAAQLAHIGAMYTPGLNDVLGVQPVSPRHWAELLGLAMTLLLAMEAHKRYRAARC
ncbi:MAG TPA: HAD-IC family P-type ATPase [Rhodocyclaceae bacterium]|nr:HAD-IC family P-type ATPase [Rhodocyclaceae bacterium]